MVLAAIIDENYQLVICDFGTNSKISGGRVLLDIRLYENMKRCSFENSKRGDTIFASHYSSKNINQLTS